jgi:hypothetical protein
MGSETGPSWSQRLDNGLGKEAGPRVGLEGGPCVGYEVGASEAGLMAG